MTGVEVFSFVFVLYLELLKGISTCGYVSACNLGDLVNKEIENILMNDRNNPRKQCFI
jgi:hypothetical protein